MKEKVQNGEGTFPERLKKMGRAFGLELELRTSEVSRKTILTIELQSIDVTGMSENEIVNELIGYLFVNRYCRCKKRAGNNAADLIRAELCVRRKWGGRFI